MQPYNPRMNPEPLANRGFDLHLLRSKSPQFDPLNARFASESFNQAAFQPRLAPTLSNRNDRAEEPESGRMEIKTDVVVSFRNMVDPEKERISTRNQYDPRNEGLSSEAAKPQNFTPTSDKNELRIPLKADVMRGLPEGYYRRGAAPERNRQPTNGISNSDVMGKVRSPSVIAPEKPSFLTNEVIPPKGMIAKDQHKPILELPLTKQSAKKNGLTIPSDQIRMSQASKSELQAPPQARDLSPKPRSYSMIQDGGPKRSLSEKIYHPGRGYIESMLDTPKALIKLLMAHSKHLPEYDKPRVITKSYRLINSFAVTTHKGIVRNYNEDRVSVLLNVQQTLPRENLSEIVENYSLFSIFDGHGGYGCCNYLKDNLHYKLLETCDFSQQSPPNLTNVYKALDFQYIKSAVDGNHKFSGSCAVSVVIGPKFGLAINVGDSRVLCSRKGGRVVEDITTDHKPELSTEFARVVKNNGELYRMSANQRTGEERYFYVRDMKELEKVNEIEARNPHIIFGPWRVKPGGLSVSRTFGDVESKMQTLGGLAGTVICDPETTSFSYDDIDFVVMGCDGIFDKLTSDKVSETVWETVDFYRDKFAADPSSYEFILGECVNNVLRRAMLNRSEDNLTVILLCFKNLFA